MNSIERTQHDLVERHGNLLSVPIGEQGINPHIKPSSTFIMLNAKPQENRNRSDVVVY